MDESVNNNQPLKKVAIKTKSRTKLLWIGIVVIVVIIGVGFMYFISSPGPDVEQEGEKLGTPSKPIEVTFRGNLIFGHEVHSFTPCGTNRVEYWVMGDSPAYDELKETYQKLLGDVEPSEYSPIYVVIEGKIIDAPKDGFGADYSKAMEVSQLISASAVESCTGVVQ